MLVVEFLARALLALDVRRENKCSIHFPLATKKGKNVNAAVFHFAQVSTPCALFGNAGREGMVILDASRPWVGLLDLD